MIGRVLARRYEVLAELGRGGMGVVYRARDPMLGRDVAVKVIPPTMLTPETAQRFQREAQLVAGMDHPGIVPIYDFGQDEGALFFVMPVLHGQNLRAFLRDRALLGEIVEVGVQVAEALEYSHAHGVVHRDVKPENIMVAVEEGVGVRVRITDFGLARSVTEGRVTRTGALVGTLSYLSPEQIAGRETTARSDVYSLGTVLFECVSSELPFSGGDVQALLYRIANEVPQPPSIRGSEIDPAFEAIIMRCLAKDPDERPARASEVADALRRYRDTLEESERVRPIVVHTSEILRPMLAPFVGRAREFAEIQEHLNAALAGECQLVAISGEPGVGKTRLADELDTLCRMRHIRVLHGRSVEQDQAFPYQGFCDAIQEFFRLKDQKRTSTGVPDLSDLGPDLVALFPMLSEIAEFRSAPDHETRASRLREGSERTAIYDLLARALTRLAQGKPLVLVLEDLHGAEMSVEALQYVVRRLGPTPTLVVATWRSTEVDARHPIQRLLEGFRGDRRFLHLELGPLSRSDHRAFLSTLLGVDKLADPLADTLYEGSEGNPFFTRELIRSLVDSGSLSRDDSGIMRLAVGSRSAVDALPDTIQQAVERRLQRLPDELREVLAAASVIGRTFDAKDLGGLVEDRKGVEDALDDLAAQGLVEEPHAKGDRLAFASGVVRDVLYAGLSRRRRRSLHRRFAEHLESRYAGRLERVLPHLVHHYSQGDVPEKTVEYGLRLAQVSLDAWSADEAARAARAALEFLDEEWEGDKALGGEARLLLGRALRMQGDLEGALAEAEAAHRIFERDARPSRAVAALTLAAEAAWQARRMDEARRWIDRGLDVAREVGDEESRRTLLGLAATVANLRAEYDLANQYLEEAARLAPPAAEAEEEALPAGGRLVVAIATPLHSLDLGAIWLAEEGELLANVFETLVGVDEGGTLVPALAERWEALDGARRFRITLREGVQFPGDHALDAEDVRASFERSVRQSRQDGPPAFLALRGLSGFLAGEDGHVSGIEVVSPRVLDLVLDEPLPVYPALLTDLRTGVAHIDGDGQALGTGPFQFDTVEQGRVVLARSSAPRGRAPRVDALEFRHGMAPAVIAAGLRSGEIDLARDLLPGDLEDLSRDPRFRRGLVETPLSNTYFVTFNTRTGPLTRHGAARRALAGAIDTRDLVWRALGSAAQPASGLIPPGLLGHDVGRRRRPLDVDAARALLSGLGPLRLAAVVHPLLLDRYGRLFNALVDVWADLGVVVDVTGSTMAAYRAALDDRDAVDIRVGRWIPDFHDPDAFATSLFHSESGLLRNYFSSPGLDQTIEAARMEGQPEAREALYRTFEDALETADALLPLFHDIDYRLAGPRVRGVRMLSRSPNVNYSSLAKVEVTAPAEPRRTGGGVLHIPVAGVVSTLEPANSHSVEQTEVLHSVFETLTRVVGGARVVPWLASEIHAEDGGRRYRFRLRDGVRFHDGRRLTPRDVRWSYERLLAGRDHPTRWLFSSIRGAKALIAGEEKELSGFRIQPSGEFVIELEQPMAFFPALLSYEVAAIVPEGTAQDAPPEACPGTGPFRVLRFDPGRRLELEANRAYWRSGYPRSEGLVFHFGVPPREIAAGFRAGRFALASDLFPADVEALRREAEYAAAHRETPRLSVYFVAFNVHTGPLADLATRTALRDTLDVPGLVQRTLGRLALPAVSFIPPGLLGHEPGPPWERPPSGAVSGPGLDLTAVVNPVFLGGFSSVAEEVSQAFKTRRANMKVVNSTLAEYLHHAKERTCDLVLGRWVADYPDTDTFATSIHSTEGILGPLVGSPELDRIVARARAETTPSVRHALYREFEDLLRTECRLVPLFHEQAYRFARPEVEGLSVAFWGQTVAYENLRIRS